MKTPVLRKLAISSATAIALLLQAGPAAASWNAVNTSLGQQVVIGAGFADLSYMVGTRKTFQYATNVLSVRNADPATAIQLTAIRFHAKNGVLVKSFLPPGSPLTIPPQAAARFEFNKATLGVNPYPKDRSNCTVFLEWQAATSVAAPVISSVMFIWRPEGTGGALFLSAVAQPFTVIAERADP